MESLAEYLRNIYLYLNKFCYLGYKISFFITAMRPSWIQAQTSLTTNIEMNVLNLRSFSYKLARPEHGNQYVTMVSETYVIFCTFQKRLQIFYLQMFAFTFNDSIFVQL